MNEKFLYQKMRYFVCQASEFFESREQNSVVHVKSSNNSCRINPYAHTCSDYVLSNLRKLSLPLLFYYFPQFFFFADIDASVLKKDKI